MSVNDGSLVQQIEELIRSANRYDIATLKAKIDSLLVKLRQTAPHRAAQLEAEHYCALGIIDYPTAIAQLKGAADADGASDSDRMFAFSALAKLTRGRVSKDLNVSYRRRALDCAKRAGETLRQVVILTNWGIIATEDGDLAVGEDRFNEAEALLPKLSPEDAGHRLVAEVRSRRAAITGKRSFRALTSPDNEGSEARYGAALANFSTAIAAVPSDAHRQVNTRLELAAELIDRGVIWFPRTAMDIQQSLDAAHRGLDAHACENCNAYYSEVLGRSLLLQGEAKLPLHPADAFMLFNDGLARLGEAESQLRARRHPKADELVTRVAEAVSMVSIETRPRKVFLSHSGRDKALVRDFKVLLDALAFEPWLDEDAMVAGTSLERGLLAGMKDSCAAVFFITDNFGDKAYLATEIDYAIAEKRAKKDHFAIITLLLSASVVDEDVPPLLRPYVYKRGPNLLVAMTELIRALPLAPTRPTWSKK